MRAALKVVSFSLALACVAAIHGVASAADKQRADVRPGAKLPPIEIKGMFIGMTTAEYIALPREMPTIGGVESKHGGDPFNLDWNEGRLEGLSFFFKAERFSDVLTAVNGKYPKLKCVESKVSNRVGGTFQQVKCTLSQAGATLMLSRFLGDIETSVLSLNSDEAVLRRAKAEERAKQSDI